MCFKMEYSTVLFIFVVCLNSILLSDSQTLRKEAYLSVPKLISAAGYPYEKHRATTPDGYSLQMHRIPAGRRTARRTDAGGKGKRVVFVMHGMMGSSGDFVIMGPERSLAYLLADAGYDVWLGNLRGTVYANHQNLTRNDPEFWEYSFHEHGKYDVPSMIDKVLNVTGQERLMFIGYSMGTTCFFTMLAQKPEYNDKIVSFVALAPAVYLDNMRSFATIFLRTVNFPEIMRERGMLSASLRREMLDLIIGTLCNARSQREDMCFSAIYSLVGEDYEQTDWDLTKIAIARMQPASWRQLEHFGKIAITGIFTSWEDGLWGAVKPYNLTNVRVPVSLLYGENDQLTEKSQVMRLAEVLKTTGMLEEVRPGCSWPKFNHLDFVFAKDVGKLLNKPLIKHIHQLYNKYG